MTVLRAATLWVALATGLAFAGEVQAQYYPPRPSEPVVRMGPPMAIEDADDPDIYAPPPPPTYSRRPIEAPYPGQAQPGPYEPRGQRQALPAPAPGTNFPAPADYPWVRDRGNPGGPVANESVPYGDRAPAQGGHIFNNGPGGPRPPSDITTGPNNAPSAINRGSAVASLPPEEQPDEGFKELPPQFKRQMVAYQTREPAGTIIIDTPNTYLYLVLGNGQAMRYGIGVGREGFTWAGAERISRMSEWPDWHPPKEMIERQPYLPRFMAGGDSNPLGARALYLGKTLYRIHGTNQPSTIGSFVSSGCIRLINDDVADLYSRVQVGTRVVVLPGATQPSVGTAGSGPATTIR
jgi:lipoprotein-anchoring transpeptidase ErfK/SrfK